MKFADVGDVRARRATVHVERPRPPPALVAAFLALIQRAREAYQDDASQEEVDGWAETVKAGLFGTAVVKVCGCGQVYDAPAWRALRLVGTQDDGAGGTLELRDCPCGSTIAIEVP